MGCCGKIRDGAIGITKALFHIANASPDVIARRRDVCRACPHAMRNPDPKFAANCGLTTLSRCEQCGCFIAAKTRVASERGPDDPP